MKILATIIVTFSLVINSSAFCAMFIVDDPHNVVRTAIILAIGFFPILLLPYVFGK